MIVLLAVWFWLHRDDCSDRALVLAAALLAVAIPFFLPHMHDRYFFAADALTLALAAAWPQLVLPAVLCEFASCSAITPICACAICCRWPTARSHSSPRS